MKQTRDERAKIFTLWDVAWKKGSIAFKALWSFVWVSVWESRRFCKSMFADPNTFDRECKWENVSLRKQGWPFKLLPDMFDVDSCRGKLHPKKVVKKPKPNRGAAEVCPLSVGLVVRSVSSVCSSSLSLTSCPSGWGHWRSEATWMRGAVGPTS